LVSMIDSPCPGEDQLPDLSRRPGRNLLVVSYRTRANQIGCAQTV